MIKILIIEDERSLREQILEMLNLEGFQLIGAENGQVGLQLAQKQQPDLILCDVMMPEVDGYEVLALLRQDASTATIPFIFLTAKADKADLRQGMVLGADDYLTKPFTKAELLGAIAAQLQKQATIDRQRQQKMDELRSNIALSLPHELRTPLAGIIGMAELFMADYDSIPPAEGLEMLETIHASAKRLYRLVQNFLLYTELELITTNQGRSQMCHDRQSHPHATIADVALWKAQQAGRLADLQLELQDAVAPIPASKLTKIAEEILDNAFKFSNPGTPVRVINGLSDRTFNFCVIDQGRGMTADQITSVGAYMQFERKLYEQQGTGLGLAISKRIIELHGGELTIESTPHQQTIVRVTFQA